MALRSPRAVATVAVLAACLGPCGCASPPPLGSAATASPELPAVDPAALAFALIEAHNRARVQAGLPELSVNPRLETAAERHVRDMAQHRRMAHRGSDGSSPFRRIQDEAYDFQRAAENVAYGQRTLDQLMKDWMRSPGHRRNILGPFTEIGAAGAIDKSGNPYWCVTFGTPFRR